MSDLSEAIAKARADSSGQPIGCACDPEVDYCCDIHAADADYASTPHPSAHYDDVERSTYYGSDNE